MTRSRWHPERLLVVAAAFVLVAGLAGPARAQAPEVDAARAQYMIKTTLVALNHANLTGNYTVLRDLGSLRFRANNTAARLAAVFAPLRDQAIDLAPIVLFEPQMAAPPGLDEEGRLRLTGQFLTRPLRVVFDLAYESTGNRWAISDVAVNTVPWPEAADEPEGEGSAVQHPAGQPPTPRRRPAQLRLLTAGRRRSRRPDCTQSRILGLAPRPASG